MKIISFLVLFVGAVVTSSCRSLSGFNPGLVPFGGSTAASFGPNVESSEKYEEELAYKKTMSENLRELPSTSSDSDLNFSPELLEISETRKRKIRLHDNLDFSFTAGKYLARHGVLKKLGRLGPTIGLELASFVEDTHIYQSKQKRFHHGWFVLWTFDHFWKTESQLLKPQFRDFDYTNYMLGAGYAFRYILSKEWQIHYRGGIAFNFIEIDTFRENEEASDSEFSDITFSTIHKIGFDYLIRSSENHDFSGANIRFGPSLFYYFAPDPLGKFELTTENRAAGPGGSLALMLDLKFEIY